MTTQIPIRRFILLIQFVFRPGENAPLKWMIQCVKNLVPDDKDTVKRAQILTGINFYGYDYIPSQRDGRTVVNHE